jgi:hypothetical protein
MPFEYDFETEEHLAAFEAGKKLVLADMHPDVIEIELLVEQQHDREIVADIMLALARWEDAAAHGDLGYFAWLKMMISTPLRSGSVSLFLVAITMFFTLAFTLLVTTIGIILMPPNGYWENIFVVPGVIAGCLFFGSVSWVFYLLQRGQRALLGETMRFDSLSEPDMTMGNKYTPWKTHELI